MAESTILRTWPMQIYVTLVNRNWRAKARPTLYSLLHFYQVDVLPINVCKENIVNIYVFQTLSVIRIPKTKWILYHFRFLATEMVIQISFRCISQLPVRSISVWQSGYDNIWRSIFLSFYPTFV